MIENTEIKELYEDLIREESTKDYSFQVISDSKIKSIGEEFNDAYDKAIEFCLGNKQIGGNHYVSHSIQPWDVIDDWDLDYYLGNVIKYVLRDKVDKVEDLEKAIHYLEKKIQLLKESK